MSDASGGATGGRAIRLVSWDILDTQNPDWHDPTVTGDATHGTTPKHYLFDENDPLNFYVYPGVAGNAESLTTAYAVNLSRDKGIDSDTQMIAGYHRNVND